MRAEETTALAVSAASLPAAFQQGTIRDIVEDIRKEVLSIVTDPTTERGRKEIASLAYKIARTKTAIDESGKKLGEDARALLNRINDDRKFARDGLDRLKEEVRRPLTEYEERERRRIEAHSNAIIDIEAYECQCGTSEDAAVKKSEAIKVHADRDWEEYGKRASEARSRVVAYLEDQYARLKKAEDEAAELARLRKEAEERARKEREEAIAREAADRAKREAEEAAQRREEAEKRRIEQEREAERIKAEKERRRIEEERERERMEAARKERESREAAERAERQRIEAEERHKREMEEAQRKAKEEAERKEAARIAEEQKRKAAEDARRRNEAHQAKVRSEATADLLESSRFLEQRDVEHVLKQIEQGRIRHVTLNF